MNPITRLATRRLSTQFFLAVGAGLASIAGFTALTLNSLGVITDVPAARMLIGAGIAQYDYAMRNQGLYLRRDGRDWDGIELAGRYTSRTTATEVLPSGETRSSTFLRKSPTAAVAELAGELSKHDPTRTLRVISLASTKELDPVQLPDAFEQRAIDYLASSSLLEFSASDTSNHRHRIVRLISPPGHSPLYLSAMVPLTSPALLASQLPWTAWTAGAGLVGLLGLLVWMGQHFVVVRVERLAQFAQTLASIDAEIALEPPVFSEHEESSKNEVHRLSFALKALYESTMAAVRILNSRPS